MLLTRRTRSDFVLYVLSTAIIRLYLIYKHWIGSFHHSASVRIFNLLSIFNPSKSFLQLSIWTPSITLVCWCATFPKHSEHRYIKSTSLHLYGPFSVLFSANRQVRGIWMLIGWEHESWFRPSLKPGIRKGFGSVIHPHFLSLNQRRSWRNHKPDEWS